MINFLNMISYPRYENQQIPHSFELKTTGDDCQFIASSEASKQVNKLID